MVCVVLVAEDEVIVRNLVRHVLEAEGHYVLAAADGAEALQLSRSYSGSIDLLITDVVMPRLDGFALVKQLLDERPNVRVLLMSGKVSEAIPDLPFLQKPFAAADFRAKVRDVLGPAPPLQ
jgi:CheY-like chemotaxis protein